jgi:hypothetical protein
MGPQNGAKSLAVGFASAMVARSLSKEIISAHGVEMSNPELSSWLPVGLG